jgi:hypothetical protein
MTTTCPYLLGHPAARAAAMRHHGHGRRDRHQRVRPSAVFASRSECDRPGPLGRRSPANPALRRAGRGPTRLPSSGSIGRLGSRHTVQVPSSLRRGSASGSGEHESRRAATDGVGPPSREASAMTSSRLRLSGTNSAHPCIIDANVILARFGPQPPHETSFTRLHETTISERHRPPNLARPTVRSKGAP